jgi:hypothetical protein
MAASAIILFAVFPGGVVTPTALLALMTLVVAWRMLGASPLWLIVGASVLGVAWAVVDFATYEFGLWGRSIAEYEQKMENPWEYRLVFTALLLAFVAAAVSVVSLCMVELGRRAFPDDER